MEVELTSIRARSPHPPDEPPTPPALKDSDVRKSTDTVETNAVSQSADTPTTSVLAMTPTMRRKARIQFAVCCWTLFLAGWNDGTTGPLLNRIQAVYHVRKDLGSRLTGTMNAHDSS